MKKLACLMVLCFALSACNAAAGTAEQQILPSMTSQAATPTHTARPTDTPIPTQTASATPTFTLTPTETRTPPPSPTPKGGGSGYFSMVADLNIIDVSVEDPNDMTLVVPNIQFITKFEMAIDDISSLRTDTLSPKGDMAAIWNCASKHCETKRGSLYLFSVDFKKMATIEAPGMPTFLDWSAEQDRLLYYLGSTMSDDYYLVKTGSEGFGEVIHLGRLNDVSWAPDRESLYTQSGSKVAHLDLDGNELESFTCIFNNACMHAPSPDGKRFAGIQKFLSTNQDNPVITISNQDFSEKETIFISENKALILSVTWLQDNRHLVVYGMTPKQRTRRFWRLDYLSVIDTETGEERRINLNVPDDAESFGPCGLSPDESYFVYLQAGGRVKEEGYILMSGRYALSFPFDSDNPEFSRMSTLEDAWESCPVWLNEAPPKNGPTF